MNPNRPDERALALAAAAGRIGAAARLVVGIALTVVAAVLFALPATAGPTFVFYGTSMLVAAMRRTGGCEVTAISNLLLHRDDQIGCALFGPIDLLEPERTGVGDPV